MKGAWWTVGALAVASLALPAAARAETRFGVGIQIGNRGGSPYRDTYRIGYDRGYSEGAEDGYKNGRKGHRYELWNEGDYRDGDEGYKRWMGPRHVYVSGFRSGFEQGYRQSFARGRAECRNQRDDRYGYDRYRDSRYDDRYRYDRRDRDDDVIYEEPPYQR
jgi:hypothetical protein